MKNYNFYIDEKVTIWQRFAYYIEAESYEKALDKMKQEMKDGNIDDDICYHTEFLTDTVEYLTPEENNGNCTKELIYKNNVVMTNLKEIP